MLIIYTFSRAVAHVDLRVGLLLLLFWGEVPSQIDFDNVRPSWFADTRVTNLQDSFDHLLLFDDC